MLRVGGSTFTDFSTLDFERLWRGRSKTTAVERRVLAEALRGVDTARVLEVGSGEGRLTPVARALAREFVALDVTRSFLERIDPHWTEPPSGFRVAANLYRLPFVDRSFSCIVMIRVYNFLAEPALALTELARVLIPGGHLLLSYEPKPSLGTLAGDVRAALARTERPFRSQTFSTADLVPVRPSSFPAWAPTRARFSRTLRAGHARIERELATGLEDFRPFKWLPTGLFPVLATVFGSAPGGVFPSRFVLASTATSGPAGPGLPPLTDTLACPSCRADLGPAELLGAWSRACPSCGFVATYAHGILDAVFDDAVEPNRAPAEGARPTRRPSG